MSKKEEKAKTYAKNVSHGRLVIQDFVECAFMVGWDCALKSQWISVNDKLPEFRQFVFVIYEYEGDIQVQNTIYLCQEDWTFGDSKVIAWMPIPSFDEILKDNKDVLERLKNK